MTHPIKTIILLAFVATMSLAADLKQEAWHKPVREYEPRDSVFVPVIDYALIEKVKVGMTLAEAKQIAGFAPTGYYIHPDYAILYTKVGEDYYEVAFLHKESQKIEAISYRKVPTKKEANKSPESVAPTSAGSGETKHSFAIYLAAEPMDKAVVAKGPNDPLSAKLVEPPIISDADIISYDWLRHIMTLRPETLKRLPHPPVYGLPFIVVADGQRIYSGLFTTMLSSVAFEVPSIMVDRKMLCTNCPPDILVIDPPFRQGLRVVSDPRSDPRSDLRVNAALTKLDKIR